MSAGPYPPIQVVDEDDQPLRGASMEEVHKDGLIHRIVMTLVEDTDGRLLLQKRSDQVSTNKLKWDVSSAGHVDEGESYETAALREMEEELGIGGVDIEEIDYYRLENNIDGLSVDRYRKIYRSVVSPGTKITFPEDEVVEVRWFTKEELKLFIQEHRGEIVDDFIQVLLKHYL